MSSISEHGSSMKSSIKTDVKDIKKNEKESKSN
jgi:hypothetical protein